MERVWNYIHYTIFNFYIRVYKLLSYIDPFRLIYKIPAIRKFYAKGGIEDMNQFTDEVIFNNKVSGLHSIWAGVQMGGLIILIEYGIFNIFQAILGKSLIQYVWEPGNSYKWIFIIVLLVLPWIINEKLLFKNDKYLKYFDEFDIETKKVKRKWAWISFGIIIGILTFFVLSFVLLSKIY
ncbi:hypothetical protein QX233_13010 [Chryseobacterium gambrini]|uniref:Uncharacterized protein n=1 Tax=Chryseobacterium gambrini TaxID=373672 RepID=A0AAJ1R6W6_9FLAO|nr:MULTISPECIES: hypothetical protein [Chryseobacterium]MDN4013389.1 hypothetical protein [Chryseobacterium gambrini]MDN4031597.1 hypothetical protein [Chryseobacterium gambrini]QWA39477.1 hypothetical protein KKI44_04510 [Chryseobacterium sp. ZHDP1]